MFYKNLIRYHMHKIIYVILAFIAVAGYFSFEKDIIDDRNSVKTKEPVTIVCKVTSVPVNDYDQTTFFAEILDGIDINCRVYVICSRNTSVCLGDKVTVKGALSAGNTPLNSFGYNVGDYLKTKGASLIFTAEDNSDIEINKGLFNSIYKMRRKVSGILFEYFTESDAQLINALLTGDKSSMSEERSESYRRAGVYHIVAVSGLHMSILLMFLAVLWLPFKAHSMRRKIICLAITLAGSIILLIFTGFGISVQRASLMAVVMCTAPLFGRKYSPFAALNAILLFLVLYEPFCITDLSLQLSFSATYGVLYGIKLTSGLKVENTKLKSFLSSIIITLCSTIATMPFLVFEFGKISVMGIVSNLIVLIPVTPLLILSYIFAILCFFATDGICTLLCYIMTPMAQTINILSDFFASFSWAYISIKPTHLVLIVSEITLFELFRASTNRKIKYAFAVLFVVANVGVLSYNTFKTETQVCFLNAGCGECTLINSSDGAVFMVDCGSSSHINFTQNEVIPALKEKNIDKIDVLFLTGFSEERASGVTQLAENGYLNKVIIPSVTPKSYDKWRLEEILKSCVKNKVSVEFVKNGSVVNHGENHRFDILYPEISTDKKSNSSMICYSNLGKRVLFCSDIRNDELTPLLNNLPKCHIVKLPSGGAYNSSTKSLVFNTQAKYTVISDSGFENGGRLSTATPALLNENTLYRTDLVNDAIEFTFTKTEILYPKRRD